MWKPVISALFVAMSFIVAQPANAQSGLDQLAIDDLFVALKGADTPAEAYPLTREIWRRWMEPEDAELAEMMGNVTNAYLSGNVSRTYELLDHLIDTHPEYAEGWNRRATLNYETGRYQASLDDIEETLKREPRHFGALSGKALVYLALGNKIKAAQAAQAARDVHPFIAAQPPLSDLVEPQVNI